MANKKRVILGAAAILVLLGGLIFFLTRRPSDEALRTALVGKWVAQDTDDSALHRRSAPVSLEEADFQRDGRLNYKVVMKDPAVPPDVQPFQWEVRKGKVILIDLGPGSTGEPAAKLRFDVNGDTLLLHWKDRPPKVFKRAGA